MKKKKRFLLFLVLVFILSACGMKGKDAPKEEKEQVENTRGEDKQEGDTQEKNTQEEGEQEGEKQEETKPEENDSQTEPDPSNNNEADTPKPDPGTPDLELSGKPLEFFGGSFHDEEGFTFDGFTLMSDYEIFEKRMELTETEVAPRLVEQEVSRKWEGFTQTVDFYQISIPGYPEAVGTLIRYNFFEKQFMNGGMTIEFPDYESAVAFLKEKDLELMSVSVEDPEGKFSKTEGENSCLFMYLDKRNIAIQMDAHITEEGKGQVSIFFSENVSRCGTVNNDSLYFKFEEKK